MSGGTVCRCGEHKKPLKERAWRVTQNRCNHSAFNGYRYEASAYSAVTCLRCPATWRTKAAYPDSLPAYDEAEFAQAVAERSRPIE